MRWYTYGDLKSHSRVQDGHDLNDKATQKFLRGIRKLESGCWTCDTAHTAGHGYLILKIKHNGVRRSFMSHRFSYEYFVGCIPDGMLVCHKCDVRSCCNPDHLFVGTDVDNMQDMVRKGRGLVGEKNHNTSFTEADVLAIYGDIDRGFTRRAIAAKFGVKPETISHIATGRNWRHLYARHRTNGSV